VLFATPLTLTWHSALGRCFPTLRFELSARTPHRIGDADHSPSSERWPSGVCCACVRTDAVWFALWRLAGARLAVLHSCVPQRPRVCGSAANTNRLLLLARSCKGYLWVEIHDCLAVASPCLCVPVCTSVCVCGRGWVVCLSNMSNSYGLRLFIIRLLTPKGALLTFAERCRGVIMLVKSVAAVAVLALIAASMPGELNALLPHRLLACALHKLPPRRYAHRCHLHLTGCTRQDQETHAKQIH
jgi:hypothetical protein